MNVVVDIGNARLKWAIAKDGILDATGTALHVDDPAVALSALIDALPDEVERVVATNVAGEEMQTLFVDALGASYSILPEMISAVSEQLGVTCAYEDPLRLGADRWVAVLAAHHLADGAACVIDAGTAVTLDVVSADGQHLGGLILAGPRLAAAALDRRTSGIGATEIASVPPQGLELLGRDTSEAVAHGAMMGVTAGLDRALDIVTEALATEPLVLATGGEAETLLPWLDASVQYRGHLVLEGLALIAASDS